MAGLSRRSADMSRTHVAVALSGGTDSAVAAVLLRRAGYQVTGVYMQLWDSAEAQQQRERVGEVCEVLGLPVVALDLRTKFTRDVVDYFAREYSLGRTPNPCVVCNRQVKFTSLCKAAESLATRWIATGHYVRVRHQTNGHHLFKAEDGNKDQSYFLYSLSQGLLSHCLFPLGHYHKSEVEYLAAQHGLPALHASQDLCFVSQENYREFLRRQRGTSPGELVDTHGRVLGHHQGIELYTVGQRRGLGLSSEQPMYVVRIEPERRRVVLGTEADLWSRRLEAYEVHWLSPEAPTEPQHFTVRMRHTAPCAQAVVTPRRKNGADIRFAEPQRAVTPGQAIVFYHGEEVVGGGTIHSTDISQEPEPEYGSFS